MREQVKASIDDLETILNNFATDYNKGLFEPLLESDVAGYLYHLWILLLGNAREVHLDTRIERSVNKNEKFDLVLGTVKNNLRVDPRLILEIKCFPLGFKSSQNRVHYKHVLDDDVPKLAKIPKPISLRFVVLFDEANYLKKSLSENGSSKLSNIIRLRDLKDEKIKVIYIENKNGIIDWETL